MGSDGVFVGLGVGGDEVEAEPVVCGFRLVDEEHGAVGEVVDDGFEAAVVEEVGDGEAAAGGGFGEGGAGGLCLCP